MSPSITPRASRLISVLVFPAVLACAALSTALALLAAADVEQVLAPAVALGLAVIGAIILARESHRRGFVHSDGVLGAVLVATLVGASLGVGATAILGFTSGLSGIELVVDWARDALHLLVPWPFG